MSRKKFFIYSLPRSRTTWLSAWLTTDQSLCLHEAGNKVNRWEDLPEYMNSFHGYEYVGNSDCGNIMIANEINTMFPDATSVIIWRPLDEVMDSLKSVGLSCDSKLFKGWFNKLNKMAKIMPEYEFSELYKPQTARLLWETLLPEIPFDLNRFNLMSSIHMEPIYLKTKYNIKPWALEYLKKEVM